MEAQQGLTLDVAEGLLKKSLHATALLNAKAAAGEAWTEKDHQSLAAATMLTTNVLLHLLDGQIKPDAGGRQPGLSGQRPGVTGSK